MKASTDLLVPSPRRATATGDRFPLEGSIPLIVEGSTELTDRSLRHLERILDKAGLANHRGDCEPASADPCVRLVHQESDQPTPDAYHFEVTNEAIEISASTGSGLFHGVSTLGQWIQLQTAETGGSPASLAGLTVDDSPGFTHRGVMLDISRNKVPTMATLFALIDRLAGWKINQLQLYTEHTFAYREHEAVWRHASPLTSHEVRDLDAYCRDRFIDLVPNQQSFGHMHRWLVHLPYRDLAECPEGIEHPFSRSREPFSLCATDPGSLELLAGLYDELLPNFSSQLFNVGLDETFDLGRGRSSTACESRGRQAVYLDYLREVHTLASERGRRIQFWADIALQHPDLIDRLPPDAIALNWGHEASHPFAEEAEALARTGLEFYVCPGTSSWSSFAGRADNALKNLKSAAVAGRENGATGMLITDWGDHGHLQPMVASYLGILAGAALAWAPDTDVHPAKPKWQGLLDMWAFDAPESGLGRIAMALGNAYLATGTPSKNGTPLFHLLMSPGDTLDHGRYHGLSIHRLEVVLAAVGHAMSDLDSFAPDQATDLAAAELRWIAQAIALAGRLGIERFAAGRSKPLNRLAADVRSELMRGVNELAESLPPLWLERNRPGGLRESLARFDDLRSLLDA